MCFYILGKDPLPLTANEDITSYKVLREVKVNQYATGLRSDVRKYRYKLGILQPKVLLRPLYSHFRSEMKININSTIGAIDTGYHSYTHAPSIWTNKKVVECIIPKGSTYFINDIKGEYVSDQIIISKIYEKPVVTA